MGCESKAGWLSSRLLLTLLFIHMEAPWQQPEIVAHCRLLAESHFYWTRQPLLEGDRSDSQLAQALYEAPFVLVSHSTQYDPVFNYANRCAQNLWKLSWEQFTTLPSRASAEPIENSRRQALLDNAKKQGVIQNYQGVRISSEGRRFYISDVTLWNVVDHAGRYHGQAARFDRWEFMEA